MDNLVFTFNSPLLPWIWHFLDWQRLFVVCAMRSLSSHVCETVAQNTRDIYKHVYSNGRIVSIHFRKNSKSTELLLISICVGEDLEPIRFNLASHTSSRVINQWWVIDSHNTFRNENEKFFTQTTHHALNDWTPSNIHASICEENGMEIINVRGRRSAFMASQRNDEKSVTHKPVKISRNWTPNLLLMSAPFH